LEFTDAWVIALKSFEQDFLINFGNPNGSINWEKLLRYSYAIIVEKKKVHGWSQVIPVTSPEDQDDGSIDDVSDVDNESYT
jgi:hypothetical protein